MRATLDHVFICCSKDAPEAHALSELGLVEGSGNRHPGQGTANRRFFFSNGYLELLWVSDRDEACGPDTKDTRLWERWSLRKEGVCPFGIVFRTEDSRLPFDTWSYTPQYLPKGSSTQFARQVPLTEPELAFLFSEAKVQRQEPMDHELPIREMSKVIFRLPSIAALSKPATAAQHEGLLAFAEGPEYELELNFVSDQPFHFNLRPTMPLVLRGGAKGVV